MIAPRVQSRLLERPCNVFGVLLLGDVDDGWTRVGAAELDGALNALLALSVIGDAFDSEMKASGSAGRDTV